jgi:hypothetical protein
LWIKSRFVKRSKHGAEVRFMMTAFALWLIVALLAGLGIGLDRRLDRLEKLLEQIDSHLNEH